MKIVAITASQIPATTANSMQVMKVCQAMAQLGNEVVLLAPFFEQPPDQRSKIPASPDELKGLYGLHQPFPIQWLKSALKWRRYDFTWRAVWRAKTLRGQVIYCWPVQAALFALLLQRPVVLEMHGPPEGRMGPLLFYLFIKLPGKKRILFITRALQTLVERKFRVKFTPENAILAPNGVDLERYQSLPQPSQARQALKFPDQFTAVYTGHLYPGRGMGLLLELARRFRQVRFLWVGGHPQDVHYWRDQLANQAITNVDLLGFVPNHQLADYQSAGDVLLMPYERVIAGSSGGNSADYCSPMKMFEYMACQRPILASDLPVIREILTERNALLCPPEAVDAWSQALERIQNDPTLGHRLASQAWRDVQALTWRARAEKALKGLANGENGG